MFKSKTILTQGDGQEPVLAKTRWLLLKRPGNLTDKQESKLAELLKCNLKMVRAYSPKEDFQLFWAYKSPCIMRLALYQSQN